MKLFLSIERGMFGYYICLYDNEGPVGRVEDYDYDNAQIARDTAREYAGVWGVALR